jgi:hypothetical protein
MGLERQGQRVLATEVLQALAAGDDIHLVECTIAGDVDISRLLDNAEGFDIAGMNIQSADKVRTVRLGQSLVFNSCVFEDNVCFAGPWEEIDTLSVVFAKDVNFNSSQFKGQTRFGGGVFCGAAGFDGCTFEKVTSFRKVAFQSRVMLRTVFFEGYAMFTGVIFEKEVRFTNTCFGKGGNFAGVTFKGRADFDGCYSKSRAVPVFESVRFARRRRGDDETFWRFIKQSCQEAGHYQLAGESFYRERCGHFWNDFRGPRYEELTSAGRLWRSLGGVRLLGEFVFGRLLFGYGERPGRVLIAGVLIIVFCAMLYACPWASVCYRNNEGPEQLSFMDGLYFSTITFTTLGFGDMYPDPQNVMTRCLAMTEAVSGAALMALFVVCLSKRYSRG